jgi:hypothetical protein
MKGRVRGDIGKSIWAKRRKMNPSGELTWWGGGWTGPHGLYDTKRQRDEKARKTFASSPFEEPSLKIKLAQLVRI